MEVGPEIELHPSDDEPADPYAVTRRQNRFWWAALLVAILGGPALMELAHVLTG